MQYVNLASIELVFVFTKNHLTGFTIGVPDHSFEYYYFAET
jgi:hypothetical protein